MTWRDFWLGAKELPFWAFPIRAVILYAFLILATRFMRQRQIAILAGHNYLMAAGIVSLAAVRMVNPESSLVSGIVIILIYAAANILISSYNEFTVFLTRAPFENLLSYVRYGIMSVTDRGRSISSLKYGFVRKNCASVLTVRCE